MVDGLDYFGMHQLFVCFRLQFDAGANRNRMNAYFPDSNQVFAQIAMGMKSGSDLLLDSLFFGFHEHFGRKFIVVRFIKVDNYSIQPFQVELLFVILRNRFEIFFVVRQFAVFTVDPDRFGVCFQPTVFDTFNVDEQFSIVCLADRFGRQYL